MIKDDLISRVISKTREQMTGVDHEHLRIIMEDELNRYLITLKEGIDSESDIPAKLLLYTDTRRLDGQSELTIKNSGYRLNRFAAFVQKNVSEVSTADIRRYLSHVMETRSLKASSMETEKSTIKAFFSWLIDEEYIAKDPTKKIKPSRIEKRLRKSLDLEEIELLRDACTGSRERAMLELFFATGVRLDELSQIDAPDLNWVDKSIRVIGKGNKERVVYFSPKAGVYIKKYLLDRPKCETEALFVTSKKPHNRMGHRSIQREIRKIADKAGLSKDVYPHLLRHSFATQGLKSGMSINVIHDLLGHDSLDTTLIYAQTDRDTAAFEYKKHINQ